MTKSRSSRKRRRSKRRADGEIHRGTYILPNLFTTANLFSGFYGIVSTIGGNYQAAAIAPNPVADWLYEFSGGAIDAAAVNLNYASGTPLGLVRGAAGVDGLAVLPTGVSAERQALPLGEDFHEQGACFAAGLRVDSNFITIFQPTRIHIY